MEMEMEGDKAAMPVGVREAVKHTLANMEELRSNLDEFLLYQKNQIENEKLLPLQRATSHLTLARATSTLFALTLRCNGIHPESHRLNKDIDRISLFQHKLNRCLRLCQDPPTQLYFQADTRFIQHSSPAEQTRSLRELAKNEAGRVGFLDTTFQRKRKSRYQPPVTVKQDQTPVLTSLHEFLLPKTASQPFHSKQQTNNQPMLPILIEDSSEEEEDDGVEVVEKVEVDSVLQYEEEEEEEEEEEDDDDDGEIQYEEEDDQLLDDDEEQVEEGQKQELKRPPVLIILDSSDED